MNKLTKIILGALAILVLAFGAGAIGAQAFPKEVPVLDEVAEQAAFDAGMESVVLPDVDALTAIAFSEGVDSVEPIVEVVTNNTETVVEVEDESFKILACDRLLYDDLSECEEEVLAENVALTLALAYINDEFNGDIADEMEDKGLVADEDDVELVNVYDDYEDITIVKSNFDREDYKFEIKVKVNDDDDKKYFILKIEVEDGEVELLNIFEE